MLELQQVSGEVQEHKISITFEASTDKMFHGSDDRDVTEAKPGDYFMWYSAVIGIVLLIKYQQISLMLGTMGKPEVIPAGSEKKLKEIKSEEVQASTDHIIEVSQLLEESLKDEISGKLMARLEAGGGINVGPLSANFKSMISSEVASILETSFKKKVAENKKLKKTLVDKTTRVISEENTRHNRTEKDWVYLVCSLKSRWIIEWYLSKIEIELRRHISSLEKTWFRRRLIEKNERILRQPLSLSSKEAVPLLVQTYDKDLGTHHIEQAQYENLRRRQKKTVDLSDEEQKSNLLKRWTQKIIPKLEPVFQLTTSLVYPISLTSK